MSLDNIRFIPTHVGNGDLFLHPS